MNYTLQDDPLIPGHRVLSRDGKVCNCPFHTPIAIPGKLQHQMTLQYKGCGTWCALFETTNPGTLRLLCSGIVHNIPINVYDKVDEKRSEEL